MRAKLYSIGTRGMTPAGVGRIESVTAHGIYWVRLERQGGYHYTSHWDFRPIAYQPFIVRNLTGEPVPDERDEEFDDELPF